MGTHGAHANVRSWLLINLDSNHLRSTFRSKKGSDSKSCFEQVSATLSLTVQQLRNVCYLPTYAIALNPDDYNRNIEHWGVY